MAVHEGSDRSDDEVSRSDSSVPDSAAWSGFLTTSSAARLAVAASAGLAIIKLMAVAHGDVQVAAALLNTVGHWTALVSIFLVVLPSLLAIPMFALAPYIATLDKTIRASDGPGSYQRRLYWCVMAFTWIASALLVLVAWWVFLGSVVIALGLGGLAWRRSNATEEAATAITPSTWSTETHTILLITVIGVTVHTALSGWMWLPSEVVTGKEETRVGYVLSVDEGWLTILRHQPRRLEYIDVRAIESRSTCDFRGSSRTVTQLVTERRVETQWPTCPTS